MEQATKLLTAKEVLDNIMSSKGSFVKAKWKSNPKPAAKHKAVTLEKVTESVVRAGISFANLSSVKMAIANGDRGEVQPLPWGTWKEFPYIIEYKGEEYLRLYPSEGNNHKSKTIYKVDGVEVTKELFASYLTDSESRKFLYEYEKPECFTIKVKNILGLPVELIES